jgi:hypothetical protein
MPHQQDIFESLKAKLKARLSQERRIALRRRFAGPLAFFFGGNLRRLAQFYGSDKWGVHWYCQHYERHFVQLRKKKIVLLEIGIGGDQYPQLGGNSLRMWRKYFSRGRIYGIDIVDKSYHNEKRIHTFQGDQGDQKFLLKVIDQIGRPDIIIDDGSHINSHVISTFETLFPLLADDGIYVVEDTQTSYWPEYGGSSENLVSAPTGLVMLKGLTDGLNHAEYKRPNYEPSYYDKWIVAMHFYHNIVFINKGRNEEGSNLIQSKSAG